MSLSFIQEISTHSPKIIVDTFRRSPDYTLSLDPIIRRKQIKKNGKIIFENTPFQDSFFTFVDTHYKHIDSINGNDIYLLESDNN